MSFKLIDNYKTLNGKRIIMIQTIEGLPCSITIDVNEALHNFEVMSNEDIIEVALDAFYRKFMMNKFINEAVEITEEKAQEISELVEQTRKVFEDAEEQLESFKERSELAQGSIIEMMEMIYDHAFRISALEGADLDVEDVESTGEPVEDLEGGDLNGEGIESIEEPVEDGETGLEGGV